MCFPGGLSKEDLRKIMRQHTDNWRKMHGKPMKRYRTWLRTSWEHIRRENRREYENKLNHRS